MVSLVELQQQMAADIQRLGSVSTAPSGVGGGAPDRAAAAAIQRRQAAHRRWAAEEDSTALASARLLADQAFSRAGAREQLKGLKDELRDLQSQLAEALSLQLRKESKCRLTTEWISDATATNERLGNSVAGFRDKRDKRTAVISEQLQALEPLEAKSNEDAVLQEKIEEAVFWYEKFLGFRVVGGGGGVKFVFNKIDPQSPQKEYSFHIIFDRDRYKLIECDPHVKDIEELVKDLDLGDHLFKFVRMAREKFQSFSMNEIFVRA